MGSWKPPKQPRSGPTCLSLDRSTGCCPAISSAGLDCRTQIGNKRPSSDSARGNIQFNQGAHQTVSSLEEKQQRASRVSGRCSSLKSCRDQKGAMSLTIAAPMLKSRKPGSDDAKCWRLPGNTRHPTAKPDESSPRPRNSESSSPTGPNYEPSSPTTKAPEIRP